MGEENDKRWAMWPWALLAMTVIAYSLSIGPLVWLWHNGYLSQSVYELVVTTIYFPLVYLDLTFESFRSLLTWYVELWRS